MPTFVLLMKANDVASRKILRSGATGAALQRKSVEALGGSIRVQFAVTGHYDVVAIADLPDEATCLALSLASSSGGLYTEALRAYSPEEVDEAGELIRAAVAILSPPQGNVEATASEENTF